MEDRIQKAVELFKSGYNCSQSVVAAFADMYGFHTGAGSAYVSLFWRRNRADA